MGARSAVGRAAVFSAVVSRPARLSPEQALLRGSGRA
jgi:hypothetical protein